MMAAKPQIWSSDEDAFLREQYFVLQRTQIAEALGRTIGSVRKRCSVLGLNQKHRAITDSDRADIRAWYEAQQSATLDDFNLSELAQRLGRTRNTISKEARRMGLTVQGRPNSERAKKQQSIRQREYLAVNEHPKGMAGKHHTEAMKQAHSDILREAAKKRTPLEDLIRTTKANATKIARYGTGNPSMQGKNPYSRTKSGKRADLDNRFFRSAWEANYARYLNFLIAQGSIAAWEYEPKTFVFEGVTRGQLTYTPDFKVIEHDASYVWHEVKGWMDAKSKAKLKRMAKFFPDEKVIVIGPDEYKAIRKWAGLIPDWEYPVKPTAW